jgi:hypothetical protein
VATVPMPGPLAEVLTNSGRGVQWKSGCRSQIRRAFAIGIPFVPCNYYQ